MFKKWYWTDDELNYLRRQYQSRNINELAKYLNRTPSSIKAKACEMGITCNPVWSVEEIEILKNNYNQHTLQEMQKLLPGRSRSGIQLKASKLGIAQRTYMYDFRFFQCIDSESKAYWLGFFFADGNVYQNTEKHIYEANLKLQAGDAGHLRKFNAAIHGNIPVAFEQGICTLTNKESECCILRCYCKDMTDDLIFHGCVPNKSFIVQFPYIPDNIIRHFIRGYFDGNGCICTDNKKRQTLSINFCGASQRFLISLREILYNFGISSYIVDEKGKNTYRLYVKGMKNVDKMWSFMFDNATVYLDRKYVKKEKLYHQYQIAQRLLRRSEMVG